MTDNSTMTEKLDIQAASDSAVGVYWKKIALAFGVGISLDGGGVAIAGDDSLSVLRAKSVLSALSDFAKDGEIDESLPDYLIFLAREGKLEEFLEQGDSVFYLAVLVLPQVVEGGVANVAKIAYG